MMTLAHAHTLLPGSLLVGDPALEFTRVHSDTRTLRAGDLFVALRGERIDANDLLPKARAAGAVAALAQRGLAEAGLPGLQVADTLAALQTLAAAWRHRFHLPLIAVAGSNGKTTVTQMIASVLRAWVGPGAFATEGNFNNHIGVPLTLLRLRQDDAAWHRAGVVELGMNHPGEIALLARMSAPTVALVNNAQREHQEFMASVEAVALENGAAIEALGPAGSAVFPADDAQAGVWRRQAGARPVLSFALEGPADVTADAAWQQGHWAVQIKTPAGSAAFSLHVAGRHNVKNALAATAAALAAGAPLPAIVRGLESFVPVKGRSQVGTVVLHGRDAVLVDDSYNANPDSVLAAIDVLAGLPGPRWLVLGDMGEVGTQGPAFHAEVGAAAAARGIEHFWCAGSLSAEAARAYGPGARHFDQVEALIDTLAQAPQAASVLVKGSRFMAMERVVKALQAKGGRDAA
jgi:UDP-N-acetylmuramoyl-tripeptide--D-alanyl-D-alanine ligase